MNHRWPDNQIPPGATFLEEHCTRCGVLSHRRATSNQFFPGGRSPCYVPEIRRKMIAQMVAQINGLVEFRAVERKGRIPSESRGRKGGSLRIRGNYLQK